MSRHSLLALAGTGSAGWNASERPSCPEWAQSRESIKLPAAAMEKIAELLENPPPAGARLRAAMKKHTR